MPSDPTRPERDPSAVLATLRALLLREEQGRLDRLEAQDHAPDARAVADVLPEAVVRAAQRDEALAHALAPTIERGLERSARKNPRVLADAIHPILLPAVRRSIQGALASALEGFNAALEHALSPRGLAWRVEAWRTGRSFAEVVLLHSLVYRVEQVFLIHHETGALLAEAAGARGPARDPELVSAMLTALQDFLEDGFGHGEDAGRLHQVEAGERSIWIASGPRAVLAAVVRGSAPRTLERDMERVLERLHVAQAEALASFDGDTAPFSRARVVLEELLGEERVRARRSAAGGPVGWVLGAAVLLGLFLGVRWFVMERDRDEAWDELRTALAEEPGYLVLAAEREGGAGTLRGLRDPLARGLEELGAALWTRRLELDQHWAPYDSPDPELTRRRATRVLEPPAGVELSVAGGRLTLRGEAPRAWVERARIAAPLVPGVDAVDLSQLLERDP